MTPFQIGDIVQARVCVANHDCERRAGPPGINKLMVKYAKKKYIMRIDAFDGRDYLCSAFDKTTMEKTGEPWWYPARWLMTARVKTPIANALKFELVI
jgi:hypothetical protein